MVKAIIRNFQAIVEAKLKVDGLTIIVGETSAGKSALLRALSSAVHNRFRSDAIRHGESQAEVLFQYPDSSDTLHVIKTPQGSPSMKLGSQVFSKLARTVPLPISTFHNMEPLQDSSISYSLNFHPQFEKPLLLEFSQRKVLELLSSSQSLNDLNLVKDSLSQKRSELRGSFSSIDSILSDLKVQHSNLSSLYSRLTPLIDSLSESYSRLEALEFYFDSISELSSLLSSPVDSQISSLQSLISLLQSYISLQSRVSSLSSLQSLLSEDLSPKILSLQSRVSSLTSVQSLRHQLTQNSVSLQSLNSLQSLLSLQDSQSSRIDSLNHILNDHLCPICGAPISNHSHVQ